MEKVTRIENYILDTEIKLREDLAEDLSVLYHRRSLIEEKYSAKKNDAEEKYRNQRESIKSICEQAKELIDGIHRKLYKKQKRLVDVEQDDSETPEKLLTELQGAIGKFEKTNLPYGNFSIVFRCCLTPITDEPRWTELLSYISRWFYFKRVEN